MPQRYKENFGSWMLVSRKARRGRGRGGGYTAAGQRPNGFVQQHPRRPPEGIETSSRYAMLEELEGGQNQPMQEAGNNEAVTPNRYDKLPRIRTNYRQPQTGSQQRAQNDNLYAPAPPVTQRRYAPSQRGGQNARGGRGRGSRRAAAETEHTVVRGYNKGKDITTTVVGRDRDQPECSQFVPEDPLLAGMLVSNKLGEWEELNGMVPDLYDGEVGPDFSLQLGQLVSRDVLQPVTHSGSKPPAKDSFTNSWIATPVKSATDVSGCTQNVLLRRLWLQ
nr:uncharacterized protein LOC109179535 isoform X2 [Ipomoea batatas]